MMIYFRSSGGRGGSSGAVVDVLSGHFGRMLVS
jgi:hypothetical protein